MISNLLFIIIGAAVFIGWILNIVALFMTMNAPLTGLFIMRLVGIGLFPLGAFLGWFY